MITNEMKAKIFALYLDADCIINDRKDKVTGQLVFDIETNDSDVANAKLILTPLNEITDEDAIEVGKMVGIWSKNDLKDMEPLEASTIGTLKGIGIAFSESFGKKWGLGMSAPFSGGVDDILAAIDFLRSKSYMLPYMGIDLFESGIAIPNNKNK